MHRKAEEEVIGVPLADDENAARRRLDGARRSRDLVNTTLAQSEAEALLMQLMARETAIHQRVAYSGSQPG
jgi:hypothetical protein